ncbi:MAG: pyridoxamine 5'-phosphate oxidase family protein [Paracoccaceae bacterium]|nr:pyridoxamine 5'-phosphate oxidase family protein [Paracoccaceae bacterium]
MQYTLDGLRDAAWQAMARGVADRRHPARHPTLGTLSADGPQLRTVILRGWSDGVAEIHTDAASGKVGQLQADPRAALHVWIDKSRLQLRLSTEVTVTLADAQRWARVPEASRTVYGGEPAPGTPITQPEDFQPAAEFARFTVLHCRVMLADILYLGAEGHQRAQYRRAEDGWDGSWVAP